MPVYVRQPISETELSRWIAEHMPDLRAELGPMLLNDARIKLNQVTGLDIQSAESISDSLPRYLEALKAQHR